MAENKIVYSDFIDKNGVEQVLNDLLKMQDYVKTLSTDAKNLAKDFNNFARSAKNTGDSLKEFDKLESKAATTKAKLTEAQKLELSMQRQLEKELAKNTDFYKSYAIAINKVKDARLKDATATQTQKKAVVSLSDSISKEAKTIEELNAQTSALTKARKQAVIGSKEFLEIEKKLASNVDRQKKLDSAVGRKQLNVGNYPTGKQLVGNIGSAIGGAALFGGVAGGVATAVTAIGNAFKDAVKEIADFDKAFTRIRALTGANAKELNTLKFTAIEASKQTGESWQNIADLQKQFAAAGLKTNEILSVQKYAIDLATASGEDLEQSAVLMIDTINAMGLSFSDSARVADVATKSMNDTNLALSDIQTTWKYVTGVAKTAGYSIEDVAAATEVLAQNGFRGETAGTALRQIFNELVKTGKPLNESLKQQADLYSKLSKSEKLEKAQKDVTVNAQNQYITLLDNISAFEKYKKANEDAAGASGKTAAEIRDNLSTAWEKLKNSINSVILGEGGGFSSFLKMAVNGMNELVNLAFKFNFSLADFFASKEIEKAAKELDKFNQSLAAGIQKFSTQKVKDELLNLRKEYVESAKAGQKLEAAQTMDMIKIYEKELQKRTDAKKQEIQTTTKLTDEQRRKQEEQARITEQKNKEKFDNEIDLLRIRAELMKNRREKELAELNIWYKEQANQHKKNAAYMIELEKLNAIKKAEIEEKYNVNSIEKDKAKAQAEIEIKKSKDKKLFELGLISQEDFNERVLNYDMDLIESEMKILDEKYNFLGMKDQNYIDSYEKMSAELIRIDKDRQIAALRGRQAKSEKEFGIDQVIAGGDMRENLNNALNIAQSRLGTEREIAIINGDPSVEEIRKIENEIEKLKVELASLDDESFFNWETKLTDALVNTGMSFEKASQNVGKMKQAFSDAASNIINAFGQMAQADIDLWQSRIDARDEAISELEDQLSEEQEKNKEGLANNYDAVKKDLDNQKALREKELQELEKAKKQKQAIDDAVTISSIITSSAAIIKGFSETFPVVGWVLGLANAAAMIGAFIKMKQTAKATQKAEHGIYSELEGKRHSNGGTDLGESGIEAEKGEGMAIFSRKAVGKYGHKNLAELTQKINKGLFDFQPKYNILAASSSNTDKLLKENNNLTKEQLNTIKRKQTTTTNYRFRK